MVLPGSWMLADPASFADFVEFLPHVHFAHGAGAFQIGIGAAYPGS